MLRGGSKRSEARLRPCFDPRRPEACTDGSYLDPKEQNLLEYKLDTFSSVYRTLAGKDVHFE